MRIDERAIGDIAIITVHGDITLNAAGSSLADRARALLEQGRRGLVFDLSNVRYVDSGGLGTLVEAYSAAKHRGCALKLAGVTRRLNDLLVITRLLNVFDCFETGEDAVQSFALRNGVATAQAGAPRRADGSGAG